MSHGVDPDGAVRLLAESLRLLAELVIGGGHEVVPGEEGQLPLLRVGGGATEGEPLGHPGRCAGGGAKETAALGTAGSGLIHEKGLRYRDGGLGPSENLAGLGLTPSGEARVRG